MAFKLTTAEVNLRDELQGELSKAWDEIVVAVKEYNRIQADAKVKVEDAVITFNKIAENVKAFTDAIAEGAQTEISTRSVEWRESESGEDAGIWRDEWKGYYLEEIDPDWPRAIDIDKPDIDLTALPVEA